MATHSTHHSLIDDLQEQKLDRSDEFTRSLDLLATGLFTRQGQFFYELIQNAEDCALADRKSRIEIILRENAIIFRNNGELFDEEDIRNLCSVGRSQKKSEDENIGFWGIGFKSVFRVTEKPHVLSGDFQFKFDREHWQEKYDQDADRIPWHVTPIWVNDPPVDGLEDWNTFYLPYIDDEYKNRVLEGVEKLENRLLLFLEDIEEIVIRDEIDDDVDRSRQFRVDERKEKCDGRQVTLSSGREWWVYTKTFDVPDYVREDKVTRERQRHTIEEREARIALEIDDEGNLDHLTEGGVHTSVFSFLPIQGVTSGMPFIIDADLLTGAGRTKPHQDAIWNDWMLQEIGTNLVGDVIDELKEHKDWRYQFQKALIPSQRPDSELFRTLDEAIRDVAEESAIIPTDSDEWVTPEEAIHPLGESVEDLHQLLSSADTAEITNLKLTHEQLNISERQRIVTDRLRINQLCADPAELRTTGTSLAEFALNRDWLQSKAKTEDAEWFVLLYELLSNSREHDDEFKNSYIVYANSELHQPDQIYLEYENQVESIIVEINAEEVFKTVPETILQSEDAEGFLERLDVDLVGPQELASDFIEYPEMLEGKATEEDAIDWFRELYTVLRGCGMDDALQKVPIVYTGKAVVTPSSESTSVLLPAEGDRVGELLDTIGESLAGSQTIPKEIIDSEYGGDKDAKKFLKALGLQSVTPHLISKEKILPEITFGEAWRSGDKPLSRETLIEYTGIVNSELNPSEINEEIAVATVDAGVQPASNAVYSLTYGANYDTNLLLETPVISASYQDTKYGDRWQSFFDSMGVKSETKPELLETALNSLPEVNRDPRNILPEIYQGIDSAKGKSIDLEGLQLFTTAGKFQSASNVYFPDSPKAKQIFPDKKFVWVPDDDDARKGLQQLGVDRASGVFEKQLKTGNTLESAVDQTTENRIHERWGEISSRIPGLSDLKPEILWVDQVQVTYSLGESAQTRSADRSSYFDDNTLYLARDFGHDWQDLAETLLDSVESGVDIDVEEIKSVFQQSVEEVAVSQVIQYESRKGRVKAKDVRDDQTLHAGYDVWTKDPRTEEERHIEIKSFSGAGTASLREEQRKQANEDSDFYLYIVTNVGSENPEIWFKRRPDEEELLNRNANTEEVLNIPRRDWERLFDGPISIRRN